jgi:hypothetical protein
MGGSIKLMVRMEGEPFLIKETSTGAVRGKLSTLDILSKEYVQRVVKNMRDWRISEGAELFHHHAYGLLLIDHVAKKIMAYNNHAGFLQASTAFLKREYALLAEDALKTGDDVFAHPDDLALGFPNTHTVITGLRAGGIIHVKGKLYSEALGHTVESLLAEVFGQDLMKAAPKDINDFHRPSKVMTDDIEDIHVSIPGWSIENGFNVPIYLNKALQHCVEEGVLSNEIVDIWKRDVEKYPTDADDAEDKNDVEDWDWDLDL